MLRPSMRIFTTNTKYYDVVHKVERVKSGVFLNISVFFVCKAAF